MDTDRRELEALLRTVAQEADRIGERLGRHGDWQYPCAVALRAHALEYARHLSRYLRPGSAEEFALLLKYQAALCTRELASLRDLFERAAVLACRLRPLARPALHPQPTVNEPARSERPPVASSSSGTKLLRVLFAG